MEGTGDGSICRCFLLSPPHVAPPEAGSLLVRRLILVDKGLVRLHAIHSLTRRLDACELIHALMKVLVQCLKRFVSALNSPSLVRSLRPDHIAWSEKGGPGTTVGDSITCKRGGSRLLRLSFVSVHTVPVPEYLTPRNRRRIFSANAHRLPYQTSAAG